MIPLLLGFFDGEKLSIKIYIIFVMGKERPVLPYILGWGSPTLVNKDTHLPVSLPRPPRLFVIVASSEIQSDSDLYSLYVSSCAS